MRIDLSNCPLTSFTSHFAPPSQLPTLHAHLVSIGCASADDESVPMLEPLTCTWYLCVFVNSLPLPLALRVWDCFLHEGRKVR